MYFTGDNGYRSFLVFVSMLSSLTVDNNKKVTSWMLTRILSDTNHLILALNQPCLIEPMVA